MKKKNTSSIINMPISKLILLCCIILIPNKILSQIHWESMILESNMWKYFAATAEPPSDWYQTTFNDNTWKSGIGGLGFGDNDDATIVPSCGSLYIRTKVNVSDISLIKDLILDIDYDDAFILYINGVERARSSNVSGSFPSFNTTLSTDHEAKMYLGGSPERFQLSPTNLVTGENTFALQILNQGLNSTDLTARVFVQANINSPNTLFHKVPSWFVPPVSANASILPFVFINTNGQTIIQNTKIMVDLKTLNSPTGYNLVTDTTYEYNGKAGVEIRGFTSAGFPKKSFTVETRYADGSNNNVKLLGLPTENDWVFNGPYPDKSLMRNALAYILGNQTGRWSPRTRHFELFINGEYNGVYMLIEKIKRDKNRLDLAKLAAKDTIGDGVTGGYILKLDRPETYDVEGIDYWVSPHRAPTTLLQKQYFLYVDPKGDELLQKQRDYIQTHITNFENALYSDNYMDKTNGYYPYINFQSFVDYYIITELSRNLDGYRISTFIHKDKDSKGGKITMGPLWDYDICFGNANFFSAGNTAGWVIDGMGNGDAYAMPFWWKKFRLDPHFNSELKLRWNTLKNSFINTTYINGVIDSIANELAEPQIRNFKKWNILNTWVWPNNYVSGSYAGEITYLKNWIRDRIVWMDKQIQALEITGINEQHDYSMDLITYPNPFIEQVHFKYYLATAGKLELEISNSMGQKVYREAKLVEPGLQEMNVNFESSQSPGIYIYQIKVNGVLRSAGKLIKQ